MCWAISALPNQGGRQCEAEIRSPPRHLQILPFILHFSSINLTFGPYWLCCFMDTCSHLAIVLSGSIMGTISHRDTAPSWWENQSEFILQSGAPGPADWLGGILYRRSAGTVSALRFGRCVIWNSGSRECAAHTWVKVTEGKMENAGKLHLLSIPPSFSPWGCGTGGASTWDRNFDGAA